ncbi:MAG: ribulose-phosphate 3-epimerase [Candidatus Tectomicrobia bacterium]|uniref:Ribulose-phosphate 3-epimerase n=1 Tax=Tectimicrobiota bacterium TaxID=2528274 RepID=A0A932FX03_UNCTE|nr:ribulose-phosphate 3-epimerase [Candidatus Tectomicrobia bacterium]
MIKIAPSILSANFGQLGKEVAEVEEAGADMIHIDVMDGHFVPNITIGPMIVKAVRKATRLPLDVHLMIADPDRYLAEFAQAGSDILTVHVEACRHLHRTLQEIKNLKVMAGVALNPATPLASVEEILPEADMILLMSVNPGFGGQRFIPSVLPKISRLKELLAAQGLQKEIEVDGGVNVENSHQIHQAGTTILVAGTAVFHSPDYRDTITRLKAIS